MTHSKYLRGWKLYQCIQISNTPLMYRKQKNIMFLPKNFHLTRGLPHLGRNFGTQLDTLLGETLVL